MNPCRRPLITCLEARPRTHRPAAKSEQKLEKARKFDGFERDQTYLYATLSRPSSMTEGPVEGGDAR